VQSPFCPPCIIQDEGARRALSAVHKAEMHRASRRLDHRIGEVKYLFIINALVVSRIMHRAERVIQRHGTQPSTGPRSDRTRAEGWRFRRRSRGHRPSKEGQRPRGATVGDATFGHRPKACRPAEPGRRASSTMSSLVKQRSEVLKRRPCAKPSEELRRGTSRTAAATAKT